MAIDDPLHKELRALLRRNQRRRKPVTEQQLTLVELVIAARVVVDVNDGRTVHAKTLVNEVAPDVVSATTALRTVREMLRKGWLEAVPYDRDQRALRLTYTRQLYNVLREIVG